MSEPLFDLRSEETTIKLFVALVEFIEHGATQTDGGVDALIDGLPAFFERTLPLLRDPANRERAKQHAATLADLDNLTSKFVDSTNPGM